MEQKKEDLIPLKEAARMLRIESDTLRKYAQKGTIEGEKPSGRWYFRREVLEARKKTSPPAKKQVLPPMDQIQNIDDHFDELAKCAKELADILEEMKDSGRNDTIDEVMEGCAEAGENFDVIEFFSKRITARLFAHLKQSHFVHGLDTLNGWGDLELSKVDDTFLRMMRLEAAARGFKGTCDLCQVKPGSKRKVVQN
jgi:DNA-binding transcriptional MerR regulator